MTQRRHVLTQPDDILGVVPVDRRGKRVESLERKSVRLLITHNQTVVGIGTEVFDADAHSRDRAFEITAGVGKRCRVGERAEGTPDVALAGGEGEPVCDKARNRNERQDDNAGAHGE